MFIFRGTGSNQIHLKIKNLPEVSFFAIYFWGDGEDVSHLQVPLVTF